MADSFNKCVRNGGTIIIVSNEPEKYGTKEGESRVICVIEGEEYLGPIMQKEMKPLEKKKMDKELERLEKEKKQEKKQKMEDEKKKREEDRLRELRKHMI